VTVSDLELAIRANYTSIEHVKRSDPDIFFTTVAYPIKGTPYHGRVSNSLVQLKPWGQSSDREITLRGRHTAEFYEQADRLLREEVSLVRLNRGQMSNPRGDEIQRRITVLRGSLYSNASEVRT